MVLVLGKLLEQGNSLFDGYQRIYENAFQIGIDTIVLCDIDWDPTKLPDVLINKHGGKVVPKIIHVGNHEECAEKVKDMYKEGDIVLFKGSKSSEMKRVIGML
jgi:UDP-N-acetylmuramyl pentapeptide synthase